MEGKLWVQTKRKHRSWRHPIHGENKVERYFVLQSPAVADQSTALLKALSLNTYKLKALFKLKAQTQVVSPAEDKCLIVLTTGLDSVKLM